MSKLGVSHSIQINTELDLVESKAGVVYHRRKTTLHTINNLYEDKSSSGCQLMGFCVIIMTTRVEILVKQQVKIVCGFLSEQVLGGSSKMFALPKSVGVHKRIVNSAHSAGLVL